MNGFDDFDTQVTAEEFYDGWTDDEADYHETWRGGQIMSYRPCTMKPGIYPIRPIFARICPSKSRKAPWVK